ncbi:MAG TPA: hypothetical protein VK485_06190 [Sphingomicrobium sp.]|nr:hypothetical protein [Sphingomicrobium sp.]
MRLQLALLPIALLASPAAAQPQPEPIQIPPELTDPATMARVGDTVGALSHALMNMPVGEVQAAIEGRPVTPADRHRTVRDVASRGDPNFEANLQRQIAQSQVTMQASMRAMAAAMPAISRAVSQAAEEIERATANLPSPTYPRR